MMSGSALQAPEEPPPPAAGARGEVLMPQQVAKSSCRHRLLHISTLLSAALILYGLLTRSFNAMGRQQRLTAAGKVDGGGATAGTSDQGGQPGDEADQDSAAANAFMGMGAIILILTFATAAVDDTLVMFFIRMREKPIRVAGHLATCGYVTAIVVMPFVVRVTFSSKYPWWRPHTIAWLVAGVFAAMTTMVAVRELMKHLNNYTSPRLQKHIVRILLMPPIYAIDCWISMRFSSMGMYLTVFREVYEAYCLWSFMSLMLNFLHNVATLRRQQADAANAFKVSIMGRSQAICAETRAHMEVTGSRGPPLRFRPLVRLD
jgi:hypothetical protein